MASTELKLSSINYTSDRFVLTSTIALVTGGQLVIIPVATVRISKSPGKSSNMATH